jgi:hypothetical protein
VTTKPPIGFACGPFRLGHDPAFAAPTLARLPGEVLEAARRLFGPSAQLGGLGEFGLDLSDEPAAGESTLQIVGTDIARLSMVEGGGWLPRLEKQLVWVRWVRNPIEIFRDVVKESAMGILEVAVFPPVELILVHDDKPRIGRF